MQINALLSEPNSDDPLMPEIASMLNKDRPKFEKTAREWTRKYAL